MNTADIQKLAHLSRIDIDESKIEKLSKDFDVILEYVNTIQEVQTSDVSYEHTKNILREDINPHENGLHTDALVGQAPESHDGFIKVPQIL
ncbi:MAG: aspartyl-tRNA(Asn)/glutamyl-tRNA(Gln) amidotransferase subunit C [Flavobacteriaceae bacterium]|jgi:aspartyl-tRNA(Asn)/glutamyl-tRNA(Gln) amidotransferase subunit C